MLAGWTPPAMSAVYAVLYRPDPETQQYAVMYVGHSSDLTTEGFPLRHPRSPCWLERAGSKWKLFVATYEVPGGLPSHRELIVRELAAVYRPSCQEQQFDQAWDDHWIASFQAPTTGPLGTSRQPDQGQGLGA